MGIFDISDEETLYIDPIFEGMAISFLSSEEVRQEYLKESSSNSDPNGFSSKVQSLCGNLEKLSVALEAHPCALRYKNADGSLKEDFLVTNNGKPVPKDNGRPQLDVAKVLVAEKERYKYLETRIEKLEEQAEDVEINEKSSQSDYDQLDAINDQIHILEDARHAHTVNEIFFGPLEKSWNPWSDKQHRKEVIEKGETLGYELLKEKFISDISGREHGENAEEEQAFPVTNGFHGGENIPAAASALYTSVMMRIQGTTQYVASQIYDSSEQNGEIVTVASPLVDSYRNAQVANIGHGYEQVWVTSTAKGGGIYQSTQATTEQLEVNKIGKKDIYMPKLGPIEALKKEYQEKYDDYQGRTHAIQSADIGRDVKSNLQRELNQKFEQFTAQTHIDLTKAEGRYNYDAKNPVIHPSIGKGLVFAGALGVGIVVPMAAGKTFITGLKAGLALDGGLAAIDILYTDKIYRMFYTEDEINSGEIKSAYLVPLREVNYDLYHLWDSMSLRDQEVELQKEYSEIRQEHDSKAEIFVQKSAEFINAQEAGADNVKELHAELTTQSEELASLKEKMTEIDTKISEIEPKYKQAREDFTNSDKEYAVYYHELKDFDEAMQKTTKVMGFDQLFELNEGMVKDLIGDQAKDNVTAIVEQDPSSMLPIMHGGHILQGQELNDKAIGYILAVHTITPVNPNLTEEQLNTIVKRGDENVRLIDTSMSRYLEPGYLIKSFNVDESVSIKDVVGPNGSVLTQENARIEAAGGITIDPLMKPEAYKQFSAIQRMMNSDDPVVADRARAQLNSSPIEIVEPLPPSEKEDLVIEPIKLQRYTAGVTRTPEKAEETLQAEAPIAASDLPDAKQSQTDITPPTPPTGAER